MPSALEYQRHRDELRKESFRRIGYTNTLYQIFRFGEVIRNTRDLFPATSTTLIRQIQQCHTELKDRKYATGVIDVLAALNVVRRSGPRVVLTPHGSALSAIVERPWYQAARKVFFLRLVLEADGDYLLNLLRLLPGTPFGSDGMKQLGVLFFNSILNVLDWRQEELSKASQAKWIKEPTIHSLQRAQDTIRYDILKEPRPNTTLTLEEKLRNLKAKRSSTRREGTGPTETLRHTLDPRRGWLTDLELVTVGGGKDYQLTQAGTSLLQRASADGFEVDNILRVPYSEPLARALELDCPAIPVDYFHQLAMHVYYDGEVREYTGTLQQFFENVRDFFPDVRLKTFRQADIVALYDCVALQAATSAELVTDRRFHELLDAALVDYSNSIYRVTGRHGGAGYISFRV